MIWALLVQWLEFAVANGEARVRFSDSAFNFERIARHVKSVAAVERWLALLFTL